MHVFTNFFHQKIKEGCSEVLLGLANTIEFLKHEYHTEKPNTFIIAVFIALWSCLFTNHTACLGNLDGKRTSRF
jgi:hypothetical protein